MIFSLYDIAHGKRGLAGDSEFTLLASYNFDLSYFEGLPNDDGIAIVADQ